MATYTLQPTHPQTGSIAQKENTRRVNPWIKTLLFGIFIAATLVQPVYSGTAWFKTSAHAGNPVAQTKLPQIGPSTVFLPFISGASIRIAATADWPTVAANPQRTSWTPEEVSGNLHIEWYRPLEAYIPQNVQIIAVGGLLYISTSNGLYTLDAASGGLVWRYETEMPLGNSPTIAGGILYVGGYDRRIHALDARTGQHLWDFSGAQAGFDTNPLVVEGKILAGNRDGYFYAIGAHATPNQGQLLWKYKTGGAIHLSAAYKDGIVYFAANDNFAYALRVSDGSLVWKSTQLPGDGYHSYWPVIFQDKVVFSAASGYRVGNPGTSSIKDAAGNPYGKIYDIERDDLFPTEPDGTLVGPLLPDQAWAHGKPIMDVSRITEYQENNPSTNATTHKPWRRVSIILNRSDGREYTFDSDGDGFKETIPVVMWGTQSGNRYPPIVGPDQLLYQSTIYQNFYIPQGRVMGWQTGTDQMSLVGGQGAVDEPQAISAGGNLIYRNVCCDRVGDWFSIDMPNRTGTLWTYNSPLSQTAVDYDEMWFGILPEDTVRLHGNYGTWNGIYHNHGDQNPIIPHGGRLFVHRSNAIIAYGTGTSRGKLPLLETAAEQELGSSLPSDAIRTRLEDEIQKMITAGLLRPGYYNNGQFGYTELLDYYDNPGDSLYTLARSYPHLSPGLQTQAASYLKSIFQNYFDPAMVATTGWNSGAPRESAPLPPEVSASLADFEPRLTSGPRFSWSYPPHNFYALWKYAQIFPADARRAYDLARTKLQVPVPATATTDYFTQKPYELNAYLSGYLGFLELQKQAGMDLTDSALRLQVTTEFNRLVSLRTSIFSKDTLWFDDYYHRRHLNIARNFMFLTPEVGELYRQNLLAQTTAALEDYQSVAPYWFVARYEAVVDEGVMSTLYNYHALFLARAYILKEDQDELSKYLDIAGFERGDLLYIQNLVAALEARTTALAPQSYLAGCEE